MYMYMSFICISGHKVHTKYKKKNWFLQDTAQTDLSELSNEQPRFHKGSYGSGQFAHFFRFSIRVSRVICVDRGVH